MERVFCSFFSFCSHQMFRKQIQKKCRKKPQHLYNYCSGARWRKGYELTFGIICKSRGFDPAEVDVNFLRKIQGQGFVLCRRYSITVTFFCIDFFCKHVFRNFHLNTYSAQQKFGIIFTHCSYTLLKKLPISLKFTVFIA